MSDLAPSVDALPSGRLAYSPTELANALGVTRVHIQNLIRRGELRSVKLGKNRLIPAAVVAELLDGAV